MWKFLLVVLVSSNVLCDSDDEPNSDEVIDDEGNLDFGELVPVGDMLLSKDQYNALYRRDSNKRVGFTKEFKRWPHGIVPIKIKDDEYSESFKNEVKTAAKYIMDRSCIQFRFDFDANEFPDYVLINLGNGKSCRSQVGNFRNGVQQLQLHEKCTNGSIVHELLHTLGFLHMHTAPNRDNHIKIIFENILPFAMNNFQKASGFVGMFKTPYDFRSIMHYSRFAFAKNKGQTTILPKEDVRGMGQRNEMTDGDVTRLNRMYRCPNYDDLSQRYEETESEGHIPDESEAVDPYHNVTDNSLEKKYEHHKMTNNVPNHKMPLSSPDLKMEFIQRLFHSSALEKSTTKNSQKHFRRTVKLLTKSILNLLTPFCDMKQKLTLLLNYVDFL